MRVVEPTPRTSPSPSPEEPFGPNGARSGRWCTWFLQPDADVRADGPAGNEELLCPRVRSGVSVGLPAVDDGTLGMSTEAGFVVGRRGANRALVRLTP